jgi:hypothetical protein
MTAFKGAYVTKYDAGGSGDNIIPDGYIKSVEKVWLDSFAFTAVITTADTITIASIPPNKKITGVEIFFPAITPTTATIQVGIQGNTSLFITSGSTVKLGASGAFLGNTGLTANTGTFYVTTGSTNTLVQMQIGVTAMTAPTAGTIYSKVTYT